MAKRSTGQPPAPTAWRWVGERGLRLATGETTLARFEMLRSLQLPEIEDMIPADDSLLLILRLGAAPPAALGAALDAPLPGVAAGGGALHEIAVAYGGTGGPDLAVLARRAGLAVDDYIDQHAEVLYRVAFIGFQPGFPYLRGLPDRLNVPRRASPRVRVPAGSVAVGGAYCGIYPAEGPGGWQLIGCADAVLFDATRAAPALLQPGDRVRFVPK